MIKKRTLATLALLFLTCLTFGLTRSFAEEGEGFSAEPLPPVAIPGLDDMEDESEAPSAKPTEATKEAKEPLQNQNTTPQLAPLPSPLEMETPTAEEARALDEFAICIKTKQRKIVVSGVSLHFFNGETGILIGQSEGKRTHTFLAKKDGIQLDETNYPLKSIRVRSVQGWLKAEGKDFREDLIIARQGTRLALVNEINLENYLYGLINKETYPSWPMEAKKAQAVAARTYALHKKIRHPKELCDLGSSALDQVYGGLKAEDEGARIAVDSTRGQVLVHNRVIAKTYYHSTCGGRTASGQSVWGDAQPYLRSISDPYCKSSPAYRWKTSFGKRAFAKALGVPQAYRDSFLFAIMRRDASGRVKRAKLSWKTGQKSISGEEIRKAIGYNKMKSTAFRFVMKGGKIFFNGKGLGHGVGMCQWGAAGMAKQGADYKTILRFYYPGVDLKRLY